MTQVKKCKYCTLQSNKGIRDRENIKEFHEKRGKPEVRDHYRDEHSIDIEGECDGCDQEFVNLDLQWTGETDRSRILPIRKAYCKQCNVANPLKHLVIKSKKVEKNED